MTAHLSAAARLALSRWSLWILFTLGLLAWVALLYWWLGLPVGSGVALIVLGLTGIVLLAAALALFILPFRGCDPRPALSCFREGAPWTALLIWLLAGVLLSYRLVFWIPEFDSLPLRFISAGARFLIASALFTGTLIFVASCCSVASRKE